MPIWLAKLCLEVEDVTVRYFQAGEQKQDIQRAFKYSLSQQDIEQAAFADPYETDLYIKMIDLEILNQDDDVFKL